MGKLLRFIWWITLISALVVGVARLTVLRWWWVPEDDPVLVASVAPTLYGGDLVLLWRATAPRFGNLVLCPDPEDPTHSVVGRILGEEGDTVVIDGTDVTVNGIRVDTESACDRFVVTDPDTGNEVEQHCDIEAAGGMTHKRGSAGGDHPALQRTEREVGEGKVFLVSDNRLYPFDSRQYGAVDRAACRESVFFRLVGKEGWLNDTGKRMTVVR